ncbi:MAG: allophanate hydrolase subunit 1 [Intrasporangium sp.]|uniref:5-oxoprolinase subunit B family protein n=1 Tax=Intrasporangium sp. TaxID=1925024 RepID=UPI00264832B9|nr:allophanate hydrolase subunit 1 [Intrasporangium sp.]MDN5795924.1 allophanate hydrolase subunit 1 [Intrasporangium sp.]
MGDTALLVQVSDIGEVLALEARLATLVRRGEGVWASVDDLVPAARTVLLVSRPGADLGALGTAVRDVARTLDADMRTLDEDKRTLDADMRTVEIHVRYDGPDLDEVARLVGLTPRQVVAAHTGTSWQVGFGGFAPGFAYLVGGDPRLEVPRRAEPRTRVPAGAVGLAGQFSGIYPRESPGGWQLLGTTDAPLWDPDRDPPALLTPGTTVQFVDVAARS